MMRELSTISDLDECRKAGKCAIYVYKTGCPWCKKFNTVFSRLANVCDNYIKCFKVEKTSDLKNYLDKILKKSGKADRVDLFPSVLVYEYKNNEDTIKDFIRGTVEYDELCKRTKMCSCNR